MKIECKLLGNLAKGVHPYGCETELLNQINYVKQQGKFKGAKKVLVIGGSSSYGLASRISLAFGSDADTICVSFERGIKNETNLGTAGWYNNIFFKKHAEKEGKLAKNFIGDAFVSQTKQEVIKYIKNEFGGKIDLLVYSIAAPKRTDPETGVVYNSALKTIGKEVKGLNINLEKETLFEQIVLPAIETEITATEKVMGGEDWKLWIQGLYKEGVLAENFKTTLFSYIGPKITQEFYHKGTLGIAKNHAYKTSLELDKFLKEKINGEAKICVSKLVTTKASVVIPIIPFYAIALFKVMQDKGLHENPIMHKYRFFKDMMYGNKAEIDDKGMYRPDAWELREDVQYETLALLGKLNSNNFKTDISAYKLFRQEFLQLNGFAVEGFDYSKEVDLEEIQKLNP